MNHPKLEYLKRFVKQNDPKEEYKVLASIGSGTYGDVFKAIHRETREPVAVKIMKIDLKDDIRSICQEIHTLRECRHPNIVQFYGSYLRNNKLWICMEYCGGQSMQDIYLYTRRPLEEDCIAFVSRETLQGLSFMHERGRIHRDIKGANILLTDDGRVKVADFGVAAQLNNTVGKRTTLIGTPYWMAPEVASIDSRGAGYDGKCDVWGVGITAIEYAELQPPMFDLDPRKALQILGTRNYRPPTLQDRHKWSRNFHSFIKCCLVKQERNRPDAATMLTHVFVTNPSLSTLLTQRLLNFKRHLEIRANQPSLLRTPSPNPPCAQPPGQHALAPNPPPSIPGAPQNGSVAIHFDRAAPTVTTANGSANVKVAEQQYLPSIHLIASDANLPTVAQVEEGHSIEQYPGATGKSTSTSSDVVSSDSPGDVVIPVDPLKVLASNGFANSDTSGQPVLPPKSTDTSDLSTSRANDASPSVILTKPQRPAPPAAILRFQSNRLQENPVFLGLDDVFGSGENSWFPSRLLQSSSEDLLREVMDAFERRRSGIEQPNASSGDLKPADRTEATSADEKVPLWIDHRKRLPVHPSSAGAAGPPPVRARSKRRAPPPPTCVSNDFTTAAEESPSTLSTACAYRMVDPSQRIPLVSRQEDYPPVNQYDNGTPGLIVRYDRSQEPATGVEQLSLAAQAPPRPPPPKVDHIGASLGNGDRKNTARSNVFDMNFDLPPTPKVLMGACFLLLFEGCPLKINATATWVNPETQSQIILFGTNDGIYFLNLIDLADGTLELLVPRRCLWLSVLKDTMMSLCGQKPQLYSHNLISLIKSKGHSHPKFLQKRFQPTTKVSNTRGCYIANVVRNPYNGMKYLCGAIENTILVMEWYNPRSSFIEVKRVEVPNMPRPVLNFDLIIYQDQPLPLVCLGVYSTPDPMRYKLHVVNLNEDSPNSTFYVDTLKPEDQLQVIKVVQLEYNTLLICFPTHATIVDLDGRVNEDREGWKAHLDFETTVHSVVCLQDSVLAFHTHGLRGVGFDGQMTQDINDDKHVYRLLGCDKNVVVESRPSDDPMSNSNIYLLAGHKDLY